MRGLLSAAVPPSSRCGRTEAPSRLRIPVRALARKPAASGSSVRATGIPKRALCEDGPAPGCITGNVPVSTYRGLDSYLGSADSLAREATTTRGLDSYLGSAERWTQTQTGVSHWRTLSKDNVTTLYGTDATCRVADPFDQARIFCWYIWLSWDDKGNAASYEYMPEDSAGISQAAAHEANRTPQTRSAQIYLKTIKYGNVQPFFPDWTAAKQTALPANWMFSVVLDYGDHASVPPAPASDRLWPVRPEPFSSYRAGFEVRTYRRVQRLLFFSDFPSEPTAGPDCLVRSLDFAGILQSLCDGA